VVMDARRRRIPDAGHDHTALFGVHAWGLGDICGFGEVNFAGGQRSLGLESLSDQN
jgi:hypothetical protein